MKLRKEVPELNLKCEDMLFNISKNKHDFDKISLIELNSIKKEPRFFDSHKNSRDEETAAEQAELKRIEKLEKMMESLNGNVQIMNEELKILKSSIYKKHSGDQNLINRKINEKRNNVASRKSEFKIPQKENRLKMKTFNDLELDLNSEKIREKNIDIKQEDFLKNILNITQDDLIKVKTKEEIGSRGTKMKSNMQNIQKEKPNVNANDDKKSKVNTINIIQYNYKFRNSKMTQKNF